MRFRAGVRCSLASTEGSCSGTTWPAPRAADIPGLFHHVVPAHVVIIRAVNSHAATVHSISARVCVCEVLLAV